MFSVSRCVCVFTRSLAFCCFASGLERAGGRSTGACASRPRKTKVPRDRAKLRLVEGRPQAAAAAVENWLQSDSPNNETDPAQRFNMSQLVGCFRASEQPRLEYRARLFLYRIWTTRRSWRTKPKNKCKNNCNSLICVLVLLLLLPVRR